MVEEVVVERILVDILADWVEEVELVMEQLMGRIHNMDIRQVQTLDPVAEVDGYTVVMVARVFLFSVFPPLK